MIYQLDKGYDKVIIEQKPVEPAKLPAHSRAAASQHIDDRPLPPTRGAYYAVPHHNNGQPQGWRTRRFLKRKNLRLSNLRYAAVERTGTQWTLLPMALSILTFIVVVGSLLIALSSFVTATQKHYTPQATTLQDILPKDNLKMYDENGTPIYQMLSQGMQTTEPLSQISPNLMHAEIAIEDQYFWSNPGYDITGIVRAALSDLTHGHIVAGGSTITQQVIKNAIVGGQDTAIRKLQEIILAPAVTRRYTKQQILAMYLNTTYYGEQAYGAEAAAFTYFDLRDTPGHSAASKLDIAQSAMLAGIPSAPNGRDPFLYRQSALTRIQEVLDEMYSQGYISLQQERQAYAEASQPGFLHRGTLSVNAAPHFVNYALNELAGILHVKVPELARSGLSVTTTLNLKLQNQILKIAQKHIAEMAQSHNMSDAAVVMIDYHTGAIRTLLGNIDPNNPQYGQFDVAADGYRQPGSSFKPFIYATAFAQRRISPGMPVLDGPLSVPMCCGQPPYTPRNYDLSYHGLVTYRYALQNSFNIPAVKVLLQTGVEPALHTAQALGVTSYEGTPNYTMVLGTLSVHLLDMTSAYGVFANGGVRIPPHSVEIARDASGRVVYQFGSNGKPVMSKQVAFLVTNVLSDNSSRTFEFGQCSMLYLFSNSQSQCYAGNPGTIRPAAVKTGTSQDFRDNWTIGYTTDYVVGVWAGNNDDSPMVNVTGVDGAGPIWHDSMLLAEQGKPVKNFSVPSGVVKKTVSYPGMTTTDWYLK